MDFASQDLVEPRVISSVSRFTAWQQIRILGNFALPSSGGFPAANMAIYVPLQLPFNYPVFRVWWINGSGAAGHVDLGIYDQDGNRIYSTSSTAQSGTNTTQYVSISGGMILSPGRYYLALAYDSTSNGVYRMATAATQAQRMGGLLQQASALPLPASATFAAMGQSFIPIFGITSDTTGF
jgi:hypothetical protein